jgi:hypothetical protein
MSTSITFFTSLDAVRGFAGADHEQAVVEPDARRALSRWDERVSHDEVAIDLWHEPGCRDVPIGPIEPFILNGGYAWAP